MKDEASLNKWFRSEVAVAFSIGAVVAGAIMFIVNSTYPIKTDVALLNQSVQSIKDNDLTHIELEITGINSTLSAYQATQIDQGKQITEILTLLKK